MSTELRAITDRLRELGLLVRVRGDLPARIEGVTDDSRAANAGTLFVAVRGSVRDGHDYLPTVEAQGAPAAIVEDENRTTLPVIVVNDARRAAAAAAAVRHGDPARKVEIVGVTGTNGKTTTVGLLRHLLDGAGGRAASIGTLGILVGSAGEPLEGGGGLTTPGPIELQRVLAELVARGVTRVAMEVSSHSLHQHRVEGLVFAAGVFTNLTRDHLDYHGTMEEYLAAKALLVGLLAPGGVAVVNADDAAWNQLPPAPKRLTFSAAGGDADVRALDVRYRPRGSEWTLAIGAERAPVTLPLIGDFNVANALAAAGAASAVGVPTATIAERLSRAPQVPGRLELLHDTPAVLRDYAHTPDALERALGAVRPFATGKLIVVFGCSGDRDKGKRPVMGDIASRMADVAIVTSDNPRTEDPERILDEIEAGMGRRPHERVEDRRTAIARALAIAGADDVIVLAGKGHETYQVRGTVKLHFDEKEIVQELTAGTR
ncbi:MAG TPA: UDP-N-acetylmuramoyl-L-alanyl-D-glutamate--2,6-diaminopimelate ligase [Gemmatimonadaceae bacterium]|nr:UDP-N-acetylmuramoyl-L-alanyl-D-glutamate--2,6-diaminopimelate ligase [Gemmatimonadaceae bacterium]